eukprot:scaffold267949_cov51-Attheya_sp.AAC.1
MAHKLIVSGIGKRDIYISQASVFYSAIIDTVGRDIPMSQASVFYSETIDTVGVIKPSQYST